jgi:hypothetical protein
MSIHREMALSVHRPLSGFHHHESSAPGPTIALTSEPKLGPARAGSARSNSHGGARAFAGTRRRLSRSRTFDPDVVKRRSRSECTPSGVRIRSWINVAPHAHEMPNFLVNGPRLNLSQHSS